MQNFPKLRERTVSYGAAGQGRIQNDFLGGGTRRPKLMNKIVNKIGAFGWPFPSPPLPPSPLGPLVVAKICNWMRNSRNSPRYFDFSPSFDGHGLAALQRCNHEVWETFTKFSCFDRHVARRVCVSVLLWCVSIALWGREVVNCPCALFRLAVNFVSSFFLR